MGVYFSGHLKGIRIGKIRVGSSQSQDQCILLWDVFVSDSPNLFFDILGLPLNRDFGDARKVNQGQVHYVRRANGERYRDIWDIFVNACYSGGLLFNFVSYFAKVVELLSLPVEELSILDKFWIIANVILG